MNNMESIIKKQNDFFKEGTTKTIEFRINSLEKLKNAIEAKETEIFYALKKDLHKSITESYTTEIGIVINEINYMIKNLNKLAKPEKVKTPPAYLGASSYIYNEPYGIVLIMAPWNYPFHLALAPLVGAMATGNCVIIKTSEYAPYTSKVINDIISNIFDERYIKVVEGAKGVSQMILQYKFDYIFFTGGPRVGRIVMESASKNLTPVTLELGGKSPCIVDENVNLNIAAKRIVWGKFINAGQTCVAPDYVLVNKKIKNKLIERMREYIKKFYGDNPLNSEDYARIINNKHFDRLKNLLNFGDVIVGGQTKKEDLYISPTIINNVDKESPLMNEEIFGPILPLIEYDELNEAIDFINMKSKPLALYVFSQNDETINYILNKTSSGGVCINDTLIHMTTEYLPFGGVGESGMGKYHGRASFDTFSHKKSVLKNTTKMDPNFKYPPYDVDLKWVKKAMNLL